MASRFERTDTVPKQALLLSLLSLWVPVASSAFFPEWTSDDVGILVWLLALVPGFLLSYYRGWKGASIALAGGMAAFSVAQAVIVVTDASLPPPEVLLGIVSVLTLVSLGSGVLSALFHRSLDQAERMALTDSGTGLANRRHAMLELEKAFAAAERGTSLSLALFDLDHFKRVNDEYGHAEGDRVLERFAGVLADHSRAMNLAGRFGGEEFVTILRETDAEGARTYADRVRKELKGLDLRCGTVTVSAGVAEYEEGMASPDVLVAAADQALYRAKNGGRDRVVVLGRQGQGTNAAPEPVTDDEDVPRGRGELVLVVDDDIDALQSVARALRRFGYTVLESPSPVRASEIVRGLDEPVDLVLVDVVMPEIGGFRLVEMLEEIQGGIRVIYMSGYSQDDVEWAGVPGAAHEYLAKPISIYALARRVRAVLDRPAMGGEAPRTQIGSTSDPLPDPGATAPESLAGEQVGSQGRIVVLQPDRGRAEFLARILREAEDRHVHATDDVPSVIDRIPHMRAELLILDLDLPGDDVDDLLDLVEVRAPRTPAILLLVGEKNRHLRQRCNESDQLTSDFLAKPFDATELETRVRNLLRVQSFDRWRGRIEDEVRGRIAARTAELEEAREEVLRRLAWAAEFRDDLTGRHAQRVGALSGLIARELGWSHERRTILEKAAPLHDLGKIAVPDSILNKPGDLTPSEREVMERHTTVGAELLSGSRNPIIQTAETVALTHHERWDGSGYPRGLTGEEIPEEGRIVAVADTFDSLTSRRPYRDGTDAGTALREIQSTSGAHFDPRVVQAFGRVVRGDDLASALNFEVVARPDVG